MSSTTDTSSSADEAKSSRTVVTSLTTSFKVRMIGMTIACVVFGVWGLYDYFVKIPRQQKAYDEYVTTKSELDALEEKGKSSTGGSSVLSPDEIKRLQSLRAEFNQVAQNGSVPSKPAAFDQWTQLAFISMLPCAPFIWWMYVKQKRMVYRIDETGTVHLPAEKNHPAEEWTADQIKDIDMSRWMAKSIATLEHVDGRSVKLDAYLHKDLHLIIGRLAHRFYPELWEEDGRKVKPDAAPEEPEPAALENEEESAAT
ncbi:MAG TPA: hypothetical protein VG711_09100 [Phycisphaerales bacterium]|nr:hypothetical protein [Phycisphaerales bacterium]